MGRWYRIPCLETHLAEGGEELVYGQVVFIWANHAGGAYKRFSSMPGVPRDDLIDKNAVRILDDKEASLLEQDILLNRSGISIRGAKKTYVRYDSRGEPPPV